MPIGGSDRWEWPGGSSARARRRERAAQAKLDANRLRMAQPSLGLIVEGRFPRVAAAATLGYVPERLWRSRSIERDRLKGAG